MKGGIGMPYIIKEKTLALIPYGSKTHVLEYSNDEMIEEPLLQILEHNCILSGSTLEGRRKGSSSLIGANYKPPIVIDEVKKLMLIPTHSHRNPKCIWLVLQNILNYQIKNNQKVTVAFKNNQKIDLEISYSIFDKQVLRAARLQSALKGRKY